MSSDPFRRLSVPDDFTITAEEWQGANIKEMIRVWGDPKTLKRAGDEGPAKTVITKSHPNDRYFLWNQPVISGPSNEKEGSRPLFLDRVPIHL